MRRNAIYVSILILTAACASRDDYLEFEVKGEGFGAGEAHVAVTQLATNEYVACTTTQVQAGSFDVELGPVLQPKVGHRVDAFVDLDGDGRCQFGADAVVSLALEPLTEATDLTFPNGAMRIGDDPSGCEAFGGVTIHVEIANVSKGLLRYALVRLNTAGTAADRVMYVGYAFAGNGRVVIDLPGAAVPGELYWVDFFESNLVDTPCATAAEVYRVPLGGARDFGGRGCVRPGGRIELTGDLAAHDLEVGQCASF
jgi:hypothetical protein